MKIRSKTALYATIVALFFSGVFLVFTDSPVFAQGSECLTVKGRVVCPGNLEYALLRGSTSLSIILGIVQVLTTIVVGLAFFYFFWNLAKYIREGDSDGKEEAKGKMLWSLLAIFVIASLWGLVAFIRNTVGIRNIEDVPSLRLPSVYFDDCGSISQTYLRIQNEYPGLGASNAKDVFVNQESPLLNIIAKPQDQKGKIVYHASDLKSGFKDLKRKQESCSN